MLLQLLQVANKSHSSSSNRIVIEMNVSTPATLSSIDAPSNSTYSSSSNTTIPKDAPSPVGSAADGACLWRSILDTHGKEIFECASHQFLDLATALQLETINTRDLVSLLAKVGRLLYTETDVVEDKTAHPLAREADRGLSTRFAQTLPCERIGQDRSDSTASPQRSPVQASPGAKTPEDR
jgi:hypothetical protein